MTEALRVEVRRVRRLGTASVAPTSYRKMSPVSKGRMEISDLRAFAGKMVCVRLDDGSEHVGVLRTELLSELSISVFLAREEASGETLYIDDIASIWPSS